MLSLKRKLIVHDVPMPLSQHAVLLEKEKNRCVCCSNRARMVRA